jgi:hypothetical protein
VVANQPMTKSECELRAAGVPHGKCLTTQYWFSFATSLHARAAVDVIAR